MTDLSPEEQQGRMLRRILGTCLGMCSIFSVRGLTAATGGNQLACAADLGAICKVSSVCGSEGGSPGGVCQEAFGSVAPLALDSCISLLATLSYLAPIES